MARFKYVRNKQELLFAIKQEMQETLDRVSERMNQALGEQIESDVYQPGGLPNLVYHGGENQGGYADPNRGEYYPTFEFLEAWKIVSNPAPGKAAVAIEFDPSKLTKDAHMGLGGSDPRRNFADIMNLAYMGYASGYTSGLTVGGYNPVTKEDTTRFVSKYRHPYWTNFIKKMTTGGKIRQWTKEESMLPLE